LVIGLLVIGHSAACAVDYDGTWFLGFNITKPPFADLRLRQAVAHAIDAGYIATRIISGETGGSFIPPGLAGNDPSLLSYKVNLPYARQLLKRAKYSAHDHRLKHLALLHTDGVKTVAIARRLQSDLQALGITLDLVEVSYRDPDKWERELRSGQYPLFLMGYKTGSDQLFSAEAAAAGTESSALLEPLFKTGGSANFTGYSSPAVDMMLDQLSVISPTMAGERELKLREIDKTLYRDLPAVVLFYIEKL